MRFGNKDRLTDFEEIKILGILQEVTGNGFKGANNFKTQMTLGTNVLIRNLMATVILFLTLPFIVGLILSLFDDSVPPPKELFFNFYGNIDIAGNVKFIIPPSVILLTLVFLFGGLYQRLVEKRNRIAINAIVVFVMWMVLFLSSMLTDGFYNFQEYGVKGFESSYVSWMIYGLGTYILLSFVNFIMVGFFMGRRIKY